MANEKLHEMSRLSSQICNQISSVFSNPTDPTHRRLISS
ncbi:BnaA03g12730D [Brassica napus]|uniref:BnaA03g12730D protein n=1 Tax=Brassica napus TaxID=3708 RepID=A0A078HMS3_BRANA|nr:BnaA03g12730D [Brassica napus]